MGENRDYCERCGTAHRSVDCPAAASPRIAALRSRIETRLNTRLCDMREGWDDSIVGFNEAWDIVRAVFNEAAGLLPAPDADGEDGR